MLFFNQRKNDLYSFMEKEKIQLSVEETKYLEVYLTHKENRKKPVITIPQNTLLYDLLIKFKLI